MKALVVGGNGFIGSHLVDRLNVLGWEVVILDPHERRFDENPAGVRHIRGDASNSYIVREALAGVDVVFHLAWTTIHLSANQDPVADIQSNLITSVQLIRACLESRVARIIFMSSGGTVYGTVSSFPTPETHPSEPVTAYGITKLAVENYLHMFRQLHGLDYVILRPSVPYGPRQNPLAKQGAVAVFLYRIGHRLPITLFGSGDYSRDFFFVGDLIQAMVLSATAELNGNRVFNIGGGVDITLINLVRRIEDLLGQHAILEHQPARPFDPPRILLDISSAREALGWKTGTDFPTGLSQTWEWISSRFD
ncbi:MAG TPA: NAD-dependent epimerase/dehydratase family protein [Candidatus Tectomicrobia bacterium]